MFAVSLILLVICGLTLSNANAVQDRFLLYPGLIVQRDRFQLMWPMDKIPSKVQWQLNNSKPIEKAVDPTKNNLELMQENQCVDLTVRLSSGGQTIKLDGTQARPVNPIVTYNGSNLRVDWSLLWPCGANSYDVEVIGHSGRLIDHKKRVTSTRIEIPSWDRCEPAELCIRANDANGEPVGHHCVERVLPVQQGKPGKPTVEEVDTGLRVGWTLTDPCEPAFFTILFRSAHGTWMSSNHLGRSRSSVIVKPDNPEVGLIYVIASYPHFHEAKSEPTAVFAPEFDLHPKPGPVFEDVLERCRRETISKRHGLRDEDLTVLFEAFSGADVKNPKLMSASWEHVTSCPIINFRLLFLSSNHTIKTPTEFIDGDSCILATTVHPVKLIVFALTVDNHNIPATNVILHPDSEISVDRSYKICSRRQKEMFIELIHDTATATGYLRHIHVTDH